MAHVALILGDQLFEEHPALDGARQVVFVESVGRLGRRRLHRRRAHLVLSAMRHRAQALREAGHDVIERREAPSIPAVVRELVSAGTEVRCAAPNDPSGRHALRAAGARLLPSPMFLTSDAEFRGWADGRRRLRMEDFYREQRRRLAVLIDGDGAPVGGQWNYDADNRRPPTGGLSAPAPWQPAEGEIDDAVRADLDRLAADGTIDLWGDDGPRAFAVTPGEAREALRDFIAHRLTGFGPFQDAMVGGERVLFHSLLSVPLNLGLLPPLEPVRAAERALAAGDAPLQSVEGFVRQIIGWREYVHGMAHFRRDPAWPKANALAADRPLPAAFWGEPAGWACLDATIDGVRADGYAHHIERLMVLGNTLLLAGVRPWEAVRWFQTAFVDGAEWVMAPNAAGMALFADGGSMTTKPYAAGGNYLNRMSDHCGRCAFDPRKRTGEDACPMTALYWTFLDRQRERLAGNHRLAMPLRSLERIADDELDAIRERAGRAMRELGVDA